MNPRSVEGSFDLIPRLNLDLNGSRGSKMMRSNSMEYQSTNSRSWMWKVEMTCYQLLIHHHHPHYLHHLQLPDAVVIPQRYSTSNPRRKGGKKGEEKRFALLFGWC